MKMRALSPISSSYFIIRYLKNKVKGIIGLFVFLAQIKRKTSKIGMINKIGLRSKNSPKNS